MATSPKWLHLRRSKTTQENSSSESKIQATLRSLKLQVFRHLTNFTKPAEPKKTAIYKDRAAASLHVLLHLPPVAGAITIVVFNLTSTFLGPVQINVLPTLQFVAKFLEILIQASIAAIVLAIIRLWAFGTNGLPYGGLIVPYRTQDISSLWSLEFWACLTAPGLRLRRKVLLGLILTTAIVLAPVVGPKDPTWL
ncbi:hypothetical protein LTR84_004828 [Exophiala bonariae]|uniref:Uncharacterized protein n=1 Tax=Exophiala bonariae TaxID=1690606 RepID=A0AAV9NNL9_9EURO|nr:hypothetical protein LTR84_004828 [Exophiala bonariae]